MHQARIQAFVAARRERPAWVGIEETLHPRTLEDGYRLQHAIHEQLMAQGDQRVGWKVGSTSAASQRGFGITEPVYAGLFASDRSASVKEALARPLTRPSVECEIAVALRHDLDGAADLSEAVLVDAIGTCHIACEIIDNRYGNQMALGVPALIADDFFQAGFVLGPENIGWQQQDLASAEGFIDIGSNRRTGSARDGLSVFDSLRWLATALARDGLSLRAGDMILTGTLVPPTSVPLQAGTVTMGITGFATIS